jgi:hypothetical protein
VLSAPSRVDRGGGGSVGSEAIRVAHRRRVWFAEPRADPPPPGTVMLPAVRLGAGVAPVSARESLHPWRLPPHQRFAEFKTARGRPSGGLESDTLDRKPEPLGLTSSFYIGEANFNTQSRTSLPAGALVLLAALACPLFLSSQGLSYPEFARCGCAKSKTHSCICKTSSSATPMSEATRRSVLSCVS